MTSSSQLKIAGLALVAGFAGAVALVHAQTAPRSMKIEPVALDNPYVLVTRDAAPCARAEPGRCEDRVVLAMGDIQLETAGRTRKMKRAEIAVFKAGDSYEPPKSGAYYEIAIKPGHPALKAPAETIAPPKNLAVFRGAKFFIYEERLAVGDTRVRHSHAQRVEIRLNNGPMLHQWVWKDDAIAESEPGIVNWREPIVHEVKNIGTQPLRNFILEFLPGK